MKTIILDREKPDYVYEIYDHWVCLKCCASWGIHYESPVFNCCPYCGVKIEWRSK